MPEESHIAGMQKSASEKRDELTDEQALGRIAQGDQSAFEVLVTRYQKLVARIAWNMLGDLNEVQDIIQETFLRAFESVAQLRNPRLFKPWLVQIALNKCRACVKQKIRARQMPIVMPAGRMSRRSGIPHLAGPALQETPDLGSVSAVETARGEESELTSALSQAIVELPEIYREAVVMRYSRELDYGEMAKVLNCPEETVRWRVFQARKILREKLQAFLG